MFWKIALITLTLMALGKAAEWIYYQVYFRTRRRGHAGYKDFAKDPDRSRNALQAMREANKAQERLNRLSPGKLVEKLFNSDEPARARDALKAQGRAAIPALVAGLRRPECRRPYAESVTSQMHALDTAKKPAQYILECLEEHPDPSFVSLVAPFCRDDDEWTRRYAVSLLGLIATDECIEPLCAALNDVEFVRSSALHSIAESAENGRLSPTFVNRAYAAVLPQIIDKHRQTLGVTPAAALFALDPAKAATDVLNPAVLSTGNPGLRAAISALRDRGVPVPEATLHGLLQSTEASPDEYPNQYIIEEVLQTLGESSTPAARAAVLRNMRSASQDVRDAATKIFCKLEGLKDPWEAAFKHAPRAKFASAPEPIQNALLCRYLIDQVCNGGFSQYFVNGYGREWRRTLSALQAIKAPVMHALLKASVEKFGPDGPSLKRYDQAVAELHQRSDDAWKTEDDAFYKDQDGREALLLQYMLANARYFQ